MSRSEPGAGRLPKGVTALPRSRNGRRFRAAIRHGKAGQVHLGLYATAWLAGFAYNVAAQAVGRASTPPNPIPDAHQPTADQVRAITAKVRRRLGLDRPPAAPEVPPDPEALLTFFEITVIGFWRSQSAAEGGERAESGLDASARRLVEAAHLLFWSRHAGHPNPLDAMVAILARRLDGSFRRADLTRAVLDDDGDDELQVARWLAYPETTPAGRGFARQVRHLYPEFFDGADHPSDAGASPGWAAVLGLDPPYSPARVRAAYRARSRVVHPDAGGSSTEFVRLQAAYEAALSYCEAEES